MSTLRPLTVFLACAAVACNKPSENRATEPAPPSEKSVRVRNLLKEGAAQIDAATEALDGVVDSPTAVTAGERVREAAARIKQVAGELKGIGRLAEEDKNGLLGVVAVQNALAKNQAATGRIKGVSDKLSPEARRNIADGLTELASAFIDFNEATRQAAGSKG